MKLEIEEYKSKQIDYEKFFDILSYFFKKVQGYYCKNQKEENRGLQNLNPKTLQNRLIELENYIVKLMNEKTAIGQKYSKLLDVQSKLTQGESLDNSQCHLDNVKKLNENLYDLSQENAILREQIESILKLKEKEIKVSPKKIDNTMHRTGAGENIFTNNYIKEQTKNFKTINPREENLDNSIVDNYKTLEQRVIELEKELRNSIINLLTYRRKIKGHREIRL